MKLDLDQGSPRRAATRHRLYQSAMTLFAASGFTVVSVQDIASTAGVSVPTFYANFSSKEHLVLPTQPDEHLVASLAAQPAALPLVERLRRVLHALIAELTAADRADLLLRWQLVLGTPALRATSAEREHATAAVLVRSLPPHPGAAVGEVSADAVVVAACLAVTTTVFLSWAESGGGTDLEELVDAGFQALHDI